MTDPSERLIADLKAALDLALARLIVNEPGDSRAVSDEFVAMAAVASGSYNGSCMTIINRELAKLG